MSVLVVDTSVAVKWMLPEPLSMEAARLQSSNYELHVPFFLQIELANVLWKSVRKGLLSRAPADGFLRQLTSLPLTWHADSSLITAAFDLAHQTSRSVYDCMYLAVAVQLGCAMVTADERFVNSLAGSPWAGTAIHLRNVSQI
jgi:predicted nucleic acid-binding protein